MFNCVTPECLCIWAYLGKHLGNYLVPFGAIWESRHVVVFPHLLDCKGDKVDDILVIHTCFV